MQRGTVVLVVAALVVAAASPALACGGGRSYRPAHVARDAGAPNRTVHKKVAAPAEAQKTTEPTTIGPGFAPSAELPGNSPRA